MTTNGLIPSASAGQANSQSAGRSISSADDLLKTFEGDMHIIKTIHLNSQDQEAGPNYFDPGGPLRAYIEEDNNNMADQNRAIKLALNDLEKIKQLLEFFNRNQLHRLEDDCRILPSHLEISMHAAYPPASDSAKEKIEAWITHEKVRPLHDTLSQQIKQRLDEMLRAKDAKGKPYFE
jgi:hypothetical protein